MRLTITRKIALAVIGIVMLCTGAMAWLTSQNLQRGFIDYLNQRQAVELDRLRLALEQYYRANGTLQTLRRNPRALHRLMEDANANRAPGRELAPPPDDPPFADGRRPPPDPMGFGRRLSLFDQDGRPLIGPPDPPPGMVRAVMVDGRAVGTLKLEPLRDIETGSDAAFIRNQVRDLLWLAAALVGVSILLAIWLARQWLRPIADMRRVAQHIARGRFDVRAPVPNHDELSELAQHVNAMALALERSERERRRLLADLSHELRTPLTVIRGEIEALIDGIRQADPRALESLHAEALRLNKLIDDLHQLALADAGDLEFHPQVLDFGGLVLDAVDRFRPRAAAAGLKLAVALPPHKLWVRADPDRLTQVIANLLENGVRYTDRGGRIQCALAARGERAELTIEDSAPGVAPGAHERLFERLYRDDPARSRERGGSGLGLSICKSLVEAHGGWIRAMPSALGGVKICIELPVTDPPA